MTNLSTLKELYNQSRPRLVTVLVGILLIISGFWIYSNFTKTEETNIKEEIKIEQASKQDNKSTGVVAGEKIEPGIGGGSEVATWTPREIAKDSLKNNDNYTIQSGDTLWQIAQGKYGSGFDWHKILEANKDKIGFLPDGSQALIIPGQVLNLPK